MPDWEGPPRWVREGRTGPGPIAPKYAKRKDRAQVRKDYAKKSGDGCAVVAIGLVGGLMFGPATFVWLVVEVFQRAFQ